jgi:hypothetical protein
MKIMNFIFGKTTGSRIRSSIGLVFLLCIGGCFYKCVSFVRPPLREEPFLTRFHTNRTTFEELRQMVQSDTNLTVLWVLADPQLQHDLPPERFKQYIALLGQVKAEEAFRDRRHDDIGFTLAEAGGFDWGWELSVVWREAPATNVVSHWKEMLFKEGVFYKPIEGNWYFRMLRVMAHFGSSKPD